MISSNIRRARQEAFQIVPETCPHVDRALEQAASTVKEHTNALRVALIEALERALDAEGRVEELEFSVQSLQQKLSEIEAQL